MSDQCEIQYSAIDTIDTKLLRIGLEMKCLRIFVRIVSESTSGDARGDNKCIGTSLFEETKTMKELPKETKKLIKARYPKITDQDLSFAIVTNNYQEYKDSGQALFNRMNIVSINYESYKANYDVLLKNESSSTIIFIQNANKLENSKITLSPFLKKESKYSAKISDRDNIETLFDDLSTSSDIPFIVYTKLVNGVNQQVYKVFSDIKEIFPKWNIAGYQPGISFYYFMGGKQRKVDILKPQDYILCSIIEKHDIGDDNKKITNLFLTYEGQTKSVETDRRIANILDIQLLKSEEIKLGGSFEMKGRFILAAFIDAIMNDDIVSKYLSRNESATAVKDRTYFYCNIDDNLLTISITRDANYKFTLKNAVSLRNVEKFRTLLSNLLGYYLQYLQQTIVDDYKACGVELKEDDAKSVKKKKKTNDTNIYSNSAAKCVAERRVIMVDDEIMLEEDDEDENYTTNVNGHIDAVRFPKDTIIEGDYAFNPHWYACKNGHVGLVHAGGNRQYLPCCFESTQYKDKTLLSRYLNDEDDEEDQKHSVTVFVKTQTMIFGNTRGLIPQKIHIFFRKHERVGVCPISERKLSFLSAISRALELNQSGKEILEELIENGNFNLCKQVFPNLNEDEIRAHFQKILDNNTHLDARDIISLVEEYYKCNVYVLSRDLGTDVPYPMRYKYKELDLGYRKRFSKYIIVYENPGTIANHDKYKSNNYELIITTDKGKGVFGLKNKYVKAYRRLLFLYKSQYVSGKKIKLYSQKTIRELLNPVKQGFDLNGKVRQLICRFDEGLILIQTDPLPPMDLPTLTLQDLDDCVYLVPNKLKSFEFFCEVNMKIIKYEEIAREYLNIFMINSKITRFIKEYLFYGFSRYLNLNNPTDLDSAVDNFINTLYVSGNQNIATTNTFSDTTYWDNNTIVYIPDEKLKGSCSYLLKWMIRFEPAMLQDYHNYRTLRTYYQNVSDYKQHFNTVVFLDKETMKSYFASERESSILQRELIEKKNEGDVYYLKWYDEKGNPDIYIVYAVNKLEKAYVVYDIWKREKYLPSLEDLTEATDIWSENKGEIGDGKHNRMQIVTIDRENNQSPKREDYAGYDPIIKIYRFFNQTFYYVLLPLE